MSLHMNIKIYFNIRKCFKSLKIDFFNYNEITNIVISCLKKIISSKFKI